MGRVPHLLAIDTAGERCAVALARLTDGAILARAEPAVGRGHGDVVMGVIAEVLHLACTHYGSIARVAASVGPGSFTGIRVGIAAAKGLALSLGCEAVGVSALEALAEPHRGAGESVLAVHDARRGEVFAALFSSDGRELAGPFAAPIGSLRLRLPALLEPLVLAGSGAELVVGELAGARIASTRAEPALEAVVRLALRPGGSGVALQPLYLRGADAKIQAPAGLRGVPAA